MTLQQLKHKGNRSLLISFILSLGVVIWVVGTV